MYHQLLHPSQALKTWTSAMAMARSRELVMPLPIVPEDEVHGGHPGQVKDQSENNLMKICQLLEDNYLGLQLRKCSFGFIFLSINGELAFLC
jgi:hypothetical protein